MKTKEIVKHTQGPWVVTQTGIKGLDLEVMRDDGESICAVLALPEEMENARLIAAAPMLYSLVRAWRNSDPSSVYVDKIDEVIAQIEGNKHA